MATDNTVLDGRLWLRCWICGDSRKHERRAHMVINLDSGNFHCFRCGVDGHIPLGQLMALVMENDPEYVETSGRFRTLPSNAKSSGLPEPMVPLVAGELGPFLRYSGVERRYKLTNEQGVVEVFEVRDLQGRVQGYHARPGWRKAFATVGSRLFGYGDHLDWAKPVRIVEGPYDVRESQDICVFGLPSRSQVKALNWKPLILCPDADVWEDLAKLEGWLKHFIAQKSWVVGVEILVDGKDPDEVAPEFRYRTDWAPVVHFYYQAKAGRIPLARSIS